MIKKQSLFSRWLEVEEYKNDKAIQSALAWIGCRPNYRALLDVFVRHDHAFDDASEIKTRLLGCIAKADAGGSVEAGEFPAFSKASQPRTAIGAWLRNACRKDLGGVPESPDKIVPVSFNGSPASGDVIAATYSALGMPAGDARALGWQIHDLFCHAKTKTWADIDPFIMGPAFGSCRGSLLYSDAILLPRIGSLFFYDPTLGAVEVKTAKLLVIRKAAARNIVSILRNVSLADCLPEKEVEALIDRAGWTVLRVY